MIIGIRTIAQVIRMIFLMRPLTKLASERTSISSEITVNTSRKNNPITCGQVRDRALVLTSNSWEINKNESKNRECQKKKINFMI